MKGFDAERSGSGTDEWAEVTENISIGCSNNCIYCYAAHKAATMWGGWCKREEWGTERLTKRANRKSYPKRDGVIMFPSMHDITPFNVEASIRVMKLILAKGNLLLVVSKPRFECMDAVFAELEDFKKQVLFRFTIGSMNDATCYFWEPGAPDPNERLQCLKVAHELGFNTSVSIEPMLAGSDSAINVVKEVYDFVTETVWIGMMRKPRLRVDMTVSEYGSAVAAIERLQSDEEILRLYRDLEWAAKVRWKDSIKEVLSRVMGANYLAAGE